MQGIINAKKELTQIIKAMVTKVWALEPFALTSGENLLEMQILKFNPRTTELQSLAICVLINPLHDSHGC